VWTRSLDSALLARGSSKSETVDISGIPGRRDFTGLEARMAKRKVEKVLLSPIATQIDKVRKRLNSLRPRVSDADQQTIDLEIEKLVKFRKDLAGFCKRMTQPFRLPLKEREK
jgi:hypothetical protein